MPEFKNPIPTVDIVIMDPSKKLVLIKRKNPPYGYALPGGFVDEGESYEDAARREAFEETNLKVTLNRQFHTYSDPKRDPRKHITSTVYLAGVGSFAGLEAKDDANEVLVVSLDRARDRQDLAFDHKRILIDVWNFLTFGTLPLI